MKVINTNKVTAHTQTEISNKNGRSHVFISKRNIVIGGAGSLVLYGLYNILKQPKENSDMNLIDAYNFDTRHKRVDVLLNSNNIRWLYKDDNKYIVCTDTQGCSLNPNFTYDKWLVDDAKSVRYIETHHYLKM
jgi:hypothetical protein